MTPLLSAYPKKLPMLLLGSSEQRIFAEEGASALKSLYAGNRIRMSYILDATHNFDHIPCSHLAMGGLWTCFKQQRIVWGTEHDAASSEEPKPRATGTTTYVSHDPRTSTYKWNLIN